MNIGMLWFDNDPKVELSTKIERAVLYYQNKYGRAPTLCFVHPSMVPQPAGTQLAAPQPLVPQTGAAQAAVEAPLAGENGQAKPSLKSGGVEVRTTRSVLPNHFWIGVNGNSAVSQMDS